MDGAPAPFFIMSNNIPTSNWRHEPGLVCTPEYRRKFAILPVKCVDGEVVWLKHYYKKYKHWTHMRIGKVWSGEDFVHTDFIERVSEADYIIRKLAENL